MVPIPEGFSLGSTVVPSLLAAPAVPAIVSEWCSVLPLVFHLASPRSEHQIVGSLALCGYLHIPLFPKLGVLRGMSRLLSHDASFLDEASAKGGNDKVVFDVNWGSVFPCANGEGSQMLIRYACSRSGPLMHLPDFVKVRHRLAQKAPPGLGSEVPSQPLHSTQPDSITATGTYPVRFRRYQILHVLSVGSGATASNVGQTQWVSYVRHLFITISVMASAIMLLLLGAFGTATILLIALAIQGICHLAQVKVVRPPGYLSNNEAGNGCMLVASRQNANVWYLFIGERGVIDTLLNKTMVSFPGKCKALATWLYLAHGLQLLAMTYVAAQKGFDGLALATVMLASWCLEWWEGGDFLARRWLQKEGKVITCKSFQFTGRMPLIGTVQMLSDTEDTSWMDSIVAKCDRRDVWLGYLNCLRFHQKQSSTCDDETCQGQVYPGIDQHWLDQNKRLALQGYQFVKERLFTDDVVEKPKE